MTRESPKEMGNLVKRPRAPNDDESHVESENEVVIRAPLTRVGVLSRIFGHNSLQSHFRHKNSRRYLGDNQ